MTTHFSTNKYVYWTNSEAIGIFKNLKGKWNMHDWENVFLIQNFSLLLLCTIHKSDEIIGNIKWCTNLETLQGTFLKLGSYITLYVS